MLVGDRDDYDFEFFGGSGAGLCFDDSHLTSANVEGRSTVRAPPNSGVDEYVVILKEDILVSCMI